MINQIAAAAGRHVSRETFDKLSRYVDLLVTANGRQNLIAASTIDHIWQRHILDCAQLVPLAPEGSWVDIGSGAGLPGVVTAILTAEPTTLVEPRRLRAEFLSSVRESIPLPQLVILNTKAAVASSTFRILTARAVGSATFLLKTAEHLSRPSSVWLLPRGRNAHKELDDLRASWQGEFRTVASVTDASASILIATGVKRRGTR